MTREPRAFFALDRGSATMSAALIAHVGGRWRLIAHCAAPIATEIEPLLARMAERVHLADAELFTELAPVDGGRALPTAEWPRLEARSSPPRRLVAVAGSRRGRLRLEEIAGRAGWLVAGAGGDDDDLLRLSSLVLSPDTSALLVGADDPPSGDERRHLPQLAALLAALVRRRPEIDVVLAGGAATYASIFDGTGSGRPVVLEPEADEPAGEPMADEPADEPGVGASEAVEPAGVKPAAVGPAVEPAVEPADRARNILIAPDAASGEPPGTALGQVLEGLRAAPDDSRAGIARAVASLAFVLDRSIEAIDVGLDGGLRCRAEPVGEGHRSVVAGHSVVAAASFAPPDPSDEMIDAVLAWSTIPLDRYRLGDRLRELRLAPWGELDGEGALLRLAAARAALERLVAATPDMSAEPAPDILIACGGVWAAVPPQIVALALADSIRHSGASQLAYDGAGLLGPLGTIDDEHERRRMIGDLADDMLVPLGSLLLPSGLRVGRTAGQLRVRSGGATAELELQPGALELVDLPPGQVATAEIDLRETGRFGARGRRFTTTVTGGLGGLLVDMRDIPLRLPDRPDARRSVLDAWQRALWGELEA